MCAYTSVYVYICTRNSLALLPQTPHLFIPPPPSLCPFHSFLFFSVPLALYIQTMYICIHAHTYKYT